LNGLPNLRQLERFLATELTALSSRTGLALLYVDIRATNRSGPVTDATLAVLVEVLRQGLRETDALFRFGDSTFVVMLTSTDPQTASSVADHTCERLRRFVSSQGSACPNAVVGVASAPTDGVTLPVLIDVARRQATVIYPPSQPPSVH
jgi:GGDEF domain-containing protein